MDKDIRVRTTHSCYEPEHERREFSQEAISMRRWGVIGKVVGHSDAHGLCFEVEHEDGTIGWYDPKELVLEHPMAKRPEPRTADSVLTVQLRVGEGTAFRQDEAIQGGELCLYGTRLPVEVFLTEIAQGNALPSIVRARELQPSVASAAISELAAAISVARPARDITMIHEVRINKLRALAQKHVEYTKANKGEPVDPYRCTCPNCVLSIAVLDLLLEREALLQAARR